MRLPTLANLTMTCPVSSVSQRNFGCSPPALEPYAAPRRAEAMPT